MNHLRDSKTRAAMSATNVAAATVSATYKTMVRVSVMLEPCRQTLAGATTPNTSGARLECRLFSIALLLSALRCTFARRLMGRQVLRSSLNLFS